MIRITTIKSVDYTLWLKRIISQYKVINSKYINLDLGNIKFNNSKIPRKKMNEIPKIK